MKVLTNPTMVVKPELCKGCGLCIANCPVSVIQFSSAFNSKGYHYAAYAGEGCTGCGICFYACPEPEAIIVWKKAAEVVDDFLASNHAEPGVKGGC
ncbi:MAG: ferredoxin family protein [Candidatus Cloacimonetes bacterium]|nr:ferredoxin family protein [Candidatus Cloacimonadota bacterium]MCA9787393.1 ferredoxin family protein [Candidatus Cloacimonadota bacterium]